MRTNPSVLSDAAGSTAAHATAAPLDTPIDTRARVRLTIDAVMYGCPSITLMISIVTPADGAGSRTSPMSSGMGCPSGSVGFADVHVSRAFDGTVSVPLRPPLRMIDGTPSTATVTGASSALATTKLTGNGAVTCATVSRHAASTTVATPMRPSPRTRSPPPSAVVHACERRVELLACRAADVRRAAVRHLGPPLVELRHDRVGALGER